MTAEVLLITFIIPGIMVVVIVLGIVVKIPECSGQLLAISISNSAVASFFLQTTDTFVQRSGRMSDCTVLPNGTKVWLKEQHCVVKNDCTQLYCLAGFSTQVNL